MCLAVHVQNTNAKLRIMVASEVSHPDHPKKGQAKPSVDTFHEMHTRRTLILPVGPKISPFFKGSHPARVPLVYDAGLLK